MSVGTRGRGSWLLSKRETAVQLEGPPSVRVHAYVHWDVVVCACVLMRKNYGAQYADVLRDRTACAAASRLIEEQHMLDGDTADHSEC